MYILQYVSYILSGMYILPCGSYILSEKYMLHKVLSGKYISQDSLYISL